MGLPVMSASETMPIDVSLRLSSMVIHELGLLHQVGLSDCFSRIVSETSFLWELANPFSVTRVCAQTTRDPRKSLNALVMREFDKSFNAKYKKITVISITF